MTRCRLSTLIFVVLIVGLSLALVVQYDRSQRREAILSRQLQETLVQWRDSVRKELSTDEHEYLTLMQSLPRDNPRRDELSARIERKRAEFNVVVDRLKTLR